ncbi:MAG: group II truncated hemoglobin [Chloroflexota bacterium]|nr:group II truncated hemoglobin [Chloroflexota bacterium]
MINIEPTLYELIGGESGLRKLVERFYDLIDSAPEAAQIRALHPKSLKGSCEKFFMFLSGWSGGPALYMEKYGHPRLRMRHVPFSIGELERDQWIWCMNKALDEMQLDAPVLQHLKARFAEAADFLRNRKEA